MAKLTETLNGVNSGKPIVDPGPAGPSFMEALANFGSGVADSVGTGFEMRARQRQRDAATARQAQQDAEASALDEFAGGIFNTQRTAEAALRNQVPDFIDLGGTGISPEMQAAADNVLRVRRAVTQGRAGPMAHELALESTISDYYQRFPDQRAEFAAFMQSQGIDHYLFRGIKTEQAAAQAEGAAEIAGRTSDYNFAVEQGLVTPNMSFDEAVIEGRRARRDVLEHQRTVEAQRLLLEQRREGRTDNAAQLTANENEYANGVISAVSQRVDGIVRALNADVANAGTDALGQADVGEMLSVFRGHIETMRHQAISDAATNNMSPETSTRIGKYFDDLSKSLDSVFTGNVRTNVAAAQNLAAIARLDLARTLPVFSGLQSMMGTPATLALIEELGAEGPVTPINQGIIDTLREEVSGYNPANPTSGMRLARVVAYLKGTEGLQDYTAEQAPTLVRMNSAVLRRTMDAVLAGDTGQVGQALVAYGNTVEAAGELQPTTASGASLYAATRTYATPEARSFLRIAIRDNPELGRAMVQASRGTAAHNLSLALAPNESMYRLRWNTQSLAYEVYLPREAYNTWAESRVGLGSSYASNQLGGQDIGSDPSVPSYEEMLDRRNIPQDMHARREAATLSARHLWNTDEYDENTTRLTAQQRWDLWSRGTTPAQVAERAGGSATSREEASRGRSQTREAIDRFGADVLDNPLAADRQPAPPATDVQRHARTTFEAAGVPWDVTNRLAMKESGWDTTADNGTAQGVFQIKNFDGTWQENVEAGLDHWLEAGRGARAALGREPTPADQYVMYQQGAGGGAALLRPANASRLAWEVLLPLYEREYGASAERVAKQAVTRNGGNLNMTAAQFAQSIRDYWNR